ncbi:LytR/AlgR family response regulator transcription factor [Carboxylicivirga linearis]|uniref:Response regulator transcription factor n=1 Tax=Carboxylicivirga linearis TaxID=1628157 RepID=A0ABS5JZA8_9BACT|nr:LytTR family DNA-binding domain-containing protein [Carboxylicivirga linearis]MBS2100174.1 response regulator transcription factor [Carboxylicivirga linearis]
MKTIRALIIDDEENNIANLQDLLQNYCPEVEICDTAQSAADGIAKIKATQPDLVFLDVQMPGGTGFDMLEALSPITFQVIFVTAFDQYAIRAIRFCAIDYLMKPVDILDLQQAVQRAIRNLQESTSKQAPQQLIENRQQEAEKLKIGLPTAERILFVELHEIVRCVGESNYTHVHLTDGKSILISKTLKEFDELLCDKGFVRTHQSHLVNLKYIRSFEKNDGGYLKMNNGTSVPVSRQRKSTVMDLFNRILN